MVTADLKYHTFQDVENKILLVDAGHYETEQIVLPDLAKKVKGIVHQKNRSTQVYITEYSTNPIRYH